MGLTKQERFQLKIDEKLSAYQAARLSALGLIDGDCAHTDSDIPNKIKLHTVEISAFLRLCDNQDDAAGKETSLKDLLDRYKIPELESSMQETRKRHRKSLNIQQMKRIKLAREKLVALYETVCQDLREKYKQDLRQFIKDSSLDKRKKDSILARTNLQFSIIDAELELARFMKDFPYEYCYDADQQDFYQKLCKSLVDLCSELASLIDDDRIKNKLKRLDSQRLSYSYSRSSLRKDAGLQSHHWMRLAEGFDNLSKDYDLIGDRRSSDINFSDFIGCLKLLASRADNNQDRAKLFLRIADHYYCHMMRLHETRSASNDINAAYCGFDNYILMAQDIDEKLAKEHIKLMKYMTLASVYARNDVAELLAAVQRSFNFWFNPDRLVTAFLLFNRRQNAAMLNSSKGDMFEISRDAILRYLKLLHPEQILSLYNKIIKESRFVTFCKNMQYLIDNPDILEISLDSVDQNEDQVVYSSIRAEGPDKSSHINESKAIKSHNKSPEDTLSEEIGNYLSKISRLISILPEALSMCCELRNIPIKDEDITDVLQCSSGIPPKKSKDSYKVVRSTFFALRSGDTKFLSRDTELESKKKGLKIESRVSPRDSVDSSTLSEDENASQLDLSESYDPDDERPSSFKIESLH